MIQVQDILVPTTRGSLTRSITLDEVGIFRVARRDVALYSVQITSGGAWGRIKVSTGLGRGVFEQLSCFTGSFHLGGGCEAGLIIELFAADRAPIVALNWREADQKVV